LDGGHQTLLSVEYMLYLCYANLTLIDDSDVLQARMMKTAGDVARIFRVDKKTVKTWAHKFRDYLSPTANPPKGNTHLFSQRDLMVLALVAQYWEEEPDYEHTYAMLNRGDQYAEHYVRIAYLNTPLLQEPPDDIDEPRRDTVLLGGMRSSHHALSLHIAEAYKQAGDELVQIALSSDTAYELLYPIFFTYRHAIEVYLKILVPAKDDTHDFSRLINAFKSKYETDFAEWARDRLNELHQIDPTSDAFRYADSKTPPPAAEILLNIRQLRVVVDHLCTGLKNKILDSSIPPAYLL
jgi:hypothetical protein